MGLMDKWKQFDAASKERGARMKEKADARWDAIHAKEHEAALKKRAKSAQKVDGKPWWESSRNGIFLDYERAEDVDLELELAAPLGWYIDDADSTDGHINVGRTATGAVLTGGWSLLFGGSRTDGNIKVNWRRDDAKPVQAASDPVALLDQLARLRDSGILTTEEFEAKKAELLARI